MKDLPLAARGAEAAPETCSSCAHFHLVSASHPKIPPVLPAIPRKFMGRKMQSTLNYLGAKHVLYVGTPCLLGF